jgi:hypothetical protein
VVRHEAGRHEQRVARDDAPAGHPDPDQLVVVDDELLDGALHDADGAGGQLGAPHPAAGPGQDQCCGQSGGTSADDRYVVSRHALRVERPWMPADGRCCSWETPAQSHRRSPHVGTPGHHTGSYVRDLRGTCHEPPQRGAPNMTITPTTLTRAAGAAAAAAGLIFVGVQIGHPHVDATSVTSADVLVRNSLKMLMAALGLAGITGMYLSQVRRNGVLGLAGYLLLGTGYLLIMSTTFVSAYVLPSLAGTAPSYVGDVLAVFTGGTATGDIGALQTVHQLQGIAYLAGGLVLGIALYRARVLARWAAALLALGGIAPVALTLLPDASNRLAAFPNGIAMIALGWSLWSTASRGMTARPAAVDGRPVTPAGAE